MSSRFFLMAALALSGCASVPGREASERAATTGGACAARWDEGPTRAGFQMIEIADAPRFIADYNRLMQAQLMADRAVVLRSRSVKRAALVAFLSGDCVERLLYLDPGLMRILEGNGDT